MVRFFFALSVTLLYPYIDRLGKRGALAAKILVLVHREPLNPKPKTKKPSTVSLKAMLLTHAMKEETSWVKCKESNPKPQGLGFRVQGLKFRV